VKLGISTYCFHRAIQRGDMTVLDVIDWAKDRNAVHVEIVPIGYNLVENPDLIGTIVAKAQQTGVALSNYAVGGNLLGKAGADLEAELKRLEAEVEVANQLGVKRFRHDLGWRPAHESTVVEFEADFQVFVDGCRRIADYAAQYGITTSIENHGYEVQGSDRVLRIVRAVDRENFRTTIDTANFLAIDEDPAVAVRKNLPYASMLHLKDFYYRKDGVQRGPGWSNTVGGRQFRGSIYGQGDIDVLSVLQAVRDSGYDGFVSIEFEGMEEESVGTEQSLNMARTLWSKVAE
jgi:inosose dehydratase